MQAFIQQRQQLSVRAAPLERSKRPRGQLHVSHVRQAHIAQRRACLRYQALVLLGLIVCRPHQCAIIALLGRSKHLRPRHANSLHKADHSQLLGHYVLRLTQ